MLTWRVLCKSVQKASWMNASWRLTAATTVRANRLWLSICFPTCRSWPTLSLTTRYNGSEFSSCDALAATQKQRFCCGVFSFSTTRPSREGDRPCSAGAKQERLSRKPEESKEQWTEERNRKTCPFIINSCYFDQHCLLVVSRVCSVAHTTAREKARVT